MGNQQDDRADDIDPKPGSRISRRKVVGSLHLPDVADGVSPEEQTQRDDDRPPEGAAREGAHAAEDSERKVAIPTSHWKGLVAQPIEAAACAGQARCKMPV
jgi:hypothetical protein